jgi:hypothetical protein
MTDDIAAGDRPEGAGPTDAPTLRSALTFLWALFEDVPGLIELRPLPASRPRAFLQWTQVPALLDFVARHPENLFVGVATRRDDTGGKLEHCQALVALFGDFDFDRMPESETRARLAEFPLPPSLVVHSGHGLHVYWLLREPFDLTHDEPRARALLKRLAAHLNADPSAAECARVLRVPGTVNHKVEDGLPPVPVTLEVCEPGRRYNPSEFEDWLPPVPADGPGAGPFRAPEAPIGPGGRRPYLFRLARSLKTKGLTEAAVLAAAREENAERCRPPTPDAHVVEQVRSAFAQPDRPGFEPVDLASLTPGDGSESEPAAAPSAPEMGPRNPWRAIQSAAALLGEAESAHDWEIEPRLIFREMLTEITAPRGLGKTNLLHAILVRLAQAGLRVLIIDRDNPRRLVKTRLRGWGVDPVTNPVPMLHVITREKAPPMTDRAAWLQFPLDTFDVVLVDSYDASTEGTGEQDSAKPSRALATLLDVCRRVGGPAFVTLGNSNKAGTHGRGSGVIEDRGDIVYEVRDATDLHPRGDGKPWWQALPPPGRADWAERATRRKRRPVYRLALICTKYRPGEEPDPVIFELDHQTTPWTYRDVTTEIEAAGQAARGAAEAERTAARERAAAALLTELARRTASGQADLGKTAAEVLLHAHGLTRKAAREVLQAEAGLRWHLVPDEADERKINVRPPGENRSTAASLDRESTHPERVCEGIDVAAQSQSGRQHSSATIPAPDAAIVTTEMLPPSSTIQPDEPKKRDSDPAASDREQLRL